MIRIERVRLPPGMRALARRENGTVFVYVSAGLPPGARVAAIRDALRAAPDAGWRSGRHPVLLSALAGGAGLRRAPEGRWAHWVLLTAAVAVAASLIAMTVLNGSGARHAAAGPPGSVPPGGQSAPGPGQPGGPSSSPASPGSLPGGPAERTPGPRAPKPQSSGTPVPVPTPGTSPTPGKPPTPGTSPTPGASPTQPRPSPPTSGPPTPGSSPTSQPGPPSPSPSPSPSTSPSGGSPAVCIVVLGVTICLG